MLSLWTFKPRLPSAVGRYRTGRGRLRKVMHQNIRFGRMPSLLPGKRLRTQSDLPVWGRPRWTAEVIFQRLAAFAETEFCSFPARLLMLSPV